MIKKKDLKLFSIFMHRLRAYCSSLLINNIDKLIWRFE